MENLQTDSNQPPSRVAMRLATRWTPKGSTKVEHALGVVYVTEAPITAVGYIGTAGKSTFNYSFRTVEARDKYIADWFAGLEATAKMRADWKAEREQPHNLMVGTIITNSWGYDQTNVDFYEVVKATASYVWLLPIRTRTEEAGFMCGNISPVVPIERVTSRQVRRYDDVSGQSEIVAIPVEPVKHKATKGYVSFKHGCGNVWEGTRRLARGRGRNCLAASASL